MVGIFRHYSPPERSAPQGSPGSWVTFIQYDDDGKKSRELPLAGLHSPEEARWFGPFFAKWASVELKRNHAAAFEEADPADLPEL